MSRYRCASCQAHWPAEATNVVCCADPKPYVDTTYVPPPDLEALPYVAKRLEICQRCKHCLQGKFCLELMRRTRKRGYLMHPLGIPRAAARCPLGEWGPETQLSPLE